MLNKLYWLLLALPAVLVCFFASTFICVCHISWSHANEYQCKLPQIQIRADKRGMVYTHPSVRHSHSDEFWWKMILDRPMNDGISVFNGPLHCRAIFEILQLIEKVYFNSTCHLDECKKRISMPKSYLNNFHKWMRNYS